jgi:ATP-dependent Clp protease ATP-binding subunit ClpC
VTEELRRTFRPEFLNRVDEIIVFHPLNEDHLKVIVELMLATIGKRILDNGLELELTQAAKDLLVKKGYDPVFGARPLRRVIQRMVEDELSEELLQGRFKAGDRIMAGADGEKLSFTKLGAAAAAADSRVGD